MTSPPIDGPDGSTLYAVTTVKDVTDLKRSEFAERLLARRRTPRLVDRLPRNTPGRRPAGVPEFADCCSVHIPNRTRSSSGSRSPGRDRARPGPDERTARLGDGSLLAEVVQTRTPLLGADVQAAGDAADQAEPAHVPGPSSTMAVPMSAGAKVIGALSFANGNETRRFDEADLRIAAEITPPAPRWRSERWLAGEHAEVAHVLQRGLAPPRLPAPRGFDLAALYRPAGEVNEVGGDFYDAFEIDGGWMVAIGDVMGRGAAAASLTGLARHTIRTAGRLTGDPREAARLVDESLKRGPEPPALQRDHHGPARDRSGPCADPDPGRRTSHAPADPRPRGRARRSSGPPAGRSGRAPSGSCRPSSSRRATSSSSTPMG